eukprot:1142645-Pelagomonas_calceolata.AAC.1
MKQEVEEGTKWTEARANVELNSRHLFPLLTVQVCHVLMDNRTSTAVSQKRLDVPGLNFVRAKKDEVLILLVLGRPGAFELWPDQDQIQNAQAASRRV